MALRTLEVIFRLQSSLVAEGMAAVGALAKALLRAPGTAVELELAVLPLLLRHGMALQRSPVISIRSFLEASRMRCPTISCTSAQRRPPTPPC